MGSEKNPVPHLYRTLNNCTCSAAGLAAALAGTLARLGAGLGTGLGAALGAALGTTKSLGTTWSSARSLVRHKFFVKTWCSPAVWAKCLHCVRTACILRTQRLGYSPKNTCHPVTRGKTERCSTAGDLGESGGEGTAIGKVMLASSAQPWCTSEPPRSYLMLMNPSPTGEGPTTTPSAMSPVDRLYLRGYPGERRDIQDCRTGNGNLS